MSLDLYIHSKSSMIIASNQIIEGLSQKGFSSALFQDYLKYEPLNDESFEFCTALGWYPHALNKADLNQILQSDDKEKIESLYSKEIIGYCNITVYSASDYHKQYGDDYPDELVGEVHQEFIDFMKNSKIVYELETSAGRSNFSVNFQTALCEILGNITQGLIEDPQMGEFFYPDQAHKNFNQH